MSPRRTALVLAVLGTLCAPGRATEKRLVGQPNALESTLRRMRKRLDSIKDYRCLYSSFAVWGARRVESDLKYFYKKPELIRAEIVGGDHQGTILIARDGKVRVKPSGILSVLTLTYDAGHPRVTDIRGNRLEETSWEYFVDEHLRSLDRLELLSERRDTFDGREALVLEAVSMDPGRTRGILRENLWVSLADDILLRFEMFNTKGQLVQAAEFTDIRLDSGLPDSLFTRFSRR